MLIGGLQRQGRVCRCTCNFFKGMSPQCISVFRIFGTDSWSKTIAGAKTGQNKGTCWLVKNLRTWPDQNLSISCKTKFGIYLIARNLWEFRWGKCVPSGGSWDYISLAPTLLKIVHIWVCLKMWYTPAILIESDHQTLNSGFHHLPVQHCHHCLQFLWCLIGHVMSQLITPFRCDEEHHVVHGNALNLPRNRGAEENLPQWTSMYCCILILFGIVCHSSISFSHFQSLEIKNDSVFKYLKPVFAPPDEHVGIG